MPSAAPATQMKNYIENSLIWSTKWKCKSTYNFYIQAFKWIHIYTSKEIKNNHPKNLKFTTEA